MSRDPDGEPGGRRPRLFIEGEEVPAGNRVRCNYCGGAVILDSSGRCPTCGNVHTDGPPSGGDAPAASSSPAAAVSSGEALSGPAAVITWRDRLRIPLLGGEHRYERWSSDRKMAFIRARARRLADSLGARIEGEDRSGEVTMRGRFSGRSFRVRLDDDGDLLFRLSMVNRKGVLLMRRDPSRKADSWSVGGDCSPENKCMEIIGSHVFIEEYRNEFDPMMAVLSTLPVPLVREIVDHMNSAGALRFCMNADQVEIDYERCYSIRLEVAVKKAFALAGKLVPIFEVGERQVLEKPRIYIGGVGLASFGKPKCSSCGQRVVRRADGRCPNCGAVMRGG